jgi:signal transduction histidine kinase
MSLKARLRIFVVALMVSVVSALSAVNLYYLTASQSEDALKRVDMSAQQVKNFVIRRVGERAADRQPEPRTFDEMKALWAEIIRDDEELQQLLQSTLANSVAIVEILVADESGVILADSTESRVGDKTYDLRNFEQWVKQKSPWGKLVEIFSYRQDYQRLIPLGAENQPGARPLFTIKVITSSVFLRKMIEPQVQFLAIIFLAALLLSTLLAVVVSNLALRPLAAIGLQIEKISRGEFKAPFPADGGAKEYAAVQSKLNLLGQQFRGAKEDVMQLRSNIEQLLERLEEVVFLFDRDDRLVMAGRAAERVLGRGRWEMMGRSLAELFPRDSQLGIAIHNAIEIHQPIRDHLIVLDIAGSPHVRLLVNVEMLEGFPRHERIGTLITLRDAESRRQIQTQLDISTRLAAISRLTGGVAHEIKNPLQAIRVHLEVLRARLAEQEPDSAPEIETIDREIMRLDRVVKTFLDFTRPVDLRMDSVDLASLIQEIRTLVAPSADRQHVNIEVDMGVDDVYVHGDRDLLQQAILNVVVNGIESMKSGGRLRLAVTRSGGECVVAISDEGGGIPPEIRDKIFNLYFSTKGKGSGIGLAMTFRVVQLHNGTIDFTSEPGRGTTFRLRLPEMERETSPGPDPTAGEQELSL